MKTAFQILLVFLFVSTQIHASDNYPAGARSLALANASVSLIDVWSTFHNQATLAGISNISGAIYYESKFGIDKLALAAGTFVLPALSGTVGLSYRQFGKGTFKETKMGLAYARRLSERLNAGLQFDYFSNQFPENDRAFGFVTFELGVSYKINKEFLLAAHVFNPVSAGFETNSGKQKMPAVFRMGGSFRPHETVLILAEVEKNGQREVDFKSGLEFVPLNHLAFRIGISGSPYQFYGGMGYSFGQITTDIAFSYHGNLGFTPSVSLQFKLK